MINILLWTLLAIFLAAVTFIPGLATEARTSNSYLLTAQYCTGAVWLVFTAYSVYCSTRESLFKTMKKMAALHWGRQIGIDLYLGLLMFCGLIFLVEGSLWIMLLWLAPTLIYGNIVPLFYAATRLPEIVNASALL